MYWKSGQVLDYNHKRLPDSLWNSLTSLDGEAIECFMDLGSFPEDRKIPVASLIAMWVEVRHLSENEAYNTLTKLENVNLIKLVYRRDEPLKMSRSFRDMYIVQHPLLRALAIYFWHRDTRLILKHREDGSWNCVKEQKCPQLVSIQAGETCPTTWPDIPVEHVQILILNFSSATFTLPSFLEKMINLRVLIISNHNSSPAVLTNLLSIHLPQSLTFVRFDKISIPSLLSISAVPLPNLQKLTLSSCEVSYEDNEPMQDVENLFTCMKELEVDYCSNLLELPDQIISITSLQKLSITNCPDLVELPDSIEKLCYLKSLVLQACTSLHSLPDSVCNLRNLEVLDLSDCSSLEELPELFGDQLRSLKMIDMRMCLNLMQLPLSMKVMNSLSQVICDEDTANLWRPFIRLLSSMKLNVYKESMTLDWLV